MNNTTPDKLERWCKPCKAKAGKDRRLRIKKESLKAGPNGAALKKTGNGNGHRKERIRTGRVPMPALNQAPRPLEKSEDLYKKFRYTLAYEICDEVVTHINSLKEKIAGELQLHRA